MADGLGLNSLVPTSWEDWPLGWPRQNDAAVYNITVTNERKTN